ncbi:MAG: DUF4186 domain-containing protein [Candidatus Omnitrophota bacterium]
MHGYDAILWKVSRSKFRRGFHLQAGDLTYARRKDPGEISLHARQFVLKRLAPAKPKNDGRQTPFRGHPVFVAQHATATCCRGCLATWHKIPKGKELTQGQQEFIVGLIMEWIKREVED